MASNLTKKIIKYFTEKDIIIFNSLKKNPKAHPFVGHELKNITKDISKRFLNDENNNKLNLNALQILTGSHNDKYIIVLDFDIYDKDTNTNCENTYELYKQYIEICQSQDGMYKSSTDINKNVIIDITDCKKLKRRLIDIYGHKQKITIHGLELMKGQNQVIPPTISSCKKTKKNKKRAFLTDEYILNINEEHNVCDYLHTLIDYYEQIEENKKENTNNNYENNHSNNKNMSKEKKNYYYLKDLIEILDKKYYHEYDYWFKLGTIIKMYCEDEYSGSKLFNYISSKSNKYKESETTKVFNNLKINNVITIGSLKKWAIDSNFSKYINWRNKYEPNSIFNFDDNTSYNYAKFFKKEFGHEFLFFDTNFYHYNGYYWKKQIICEDIHNYINTKMYNKLWSIYSAIKSNNPSYDEKGIKMKNINLLHQIKTKENIVKELKVMLFRGDTFEFDKMPNIVQHGNCVYDLYENKFFKCKPEYYTSLTTNLFFDFNDCVNNQLYVKKDIEKIQKLNNIIDNIFHNEKDNKELYLQILSTGFYGKSIENFIICNGAGRNGKGLINELMMFTCNDYGYNADSNMLLDIKKNSGPNPELANMNNKRFVLTSEPSDNKKYNTAVIKEITGNSTINARKCNSNNTKTNLRLTLICETNHDLRFSATDCGINDRLIEIPFKSYFTNDDEELNKDESIFKINSYFKSIEFKENYASSFFLLLTNYWIRYYKNKKFILNEKQIKLKERYMIYSDDIMIWFYDTYKKTDNKNDIIQFKNIYNDYKDSEYFDNLTKKNKRLHNKKWMIKTFQINPILKKHFKKEIKINNIKYKSVLRGFIKI